MHACSYFNSHIYAHKICITFLKKETNMSFTTFSGLLSRRYNNNMSMVDNYWETSILRSDNNDVDHGESFSSIVYPSYSDFPPGFNPNQFLDVFPSESNSLNWRNISSENQQSKEEDEKNYSDVSLLQSSSNVFEEGEPQRKLDTFAVLESGMLVDFSLPMTNSTNFQDPYYQRNFSEMALAVPEIHSTLAPQLNCHKYVNKNEEGNLNDGYNWRKYGQKQVNGGENPRSYYRCTEPNCTMKKKVEKNLDGKIIDIIYKGNHNHPKPSKPVGNANFQSVNELYASYTNLGNLNQQSIGGGDEDQLGAHTKRLKGENGIHSYLFTPNGGKAMKEPRVVVQTTTEIDVLDDGYKWRKYGQKIVKGNPNPRNYYKCVSPGCNVKKHVERAADDIRSVMTTYEGKHNHDVPQGRSSFASRIVSLTNNFATPSSSLSSLPLHDTRLSLSSPRANNENHQSNEELTTLPFIGGIPNFGSH